MGLLPHIFTQPPGCALPSYHLHTCDSQGPPIVKVNPQPEAALGPEELRPQAHQIPSWALSLKTPFSNTGLTFPTRKGRIAKVNTSFAQGMVRRILLKEGAKVTTVSIPNQASYSGKTAHSANKSNKCNI